MTSVYIAIGMNLIAVLVLLGACWVGIRGLGGITTLRSELIVLRTEVERTDERITREVKARAGQAGADKIAEERTILQQAQAQLAHADNLIAFDERPKRPVRRN